MRTPRRSKINSFRSIFAIDTLFIISCKFLTSTLYNRIFSHIFSNRVREKDFRFSFFFTGNFIEISFTEFPYRSIYIRLPYVCYAHKLNKSTNLTCCFLERINKSWRRKIPMYIYTFANKHSFSLSIFQFGNSSLTINRILTFLS